MFPAKVNTRRDMSVGIFRFNDFELDLRSGELRKRGRALRLQQQPALVLAILVAARGEIVTREELRNRIWGRDTHVDFDRAINKAINHLRQLLSDDADRPRFIQTLPKRGYRFVASIAQSTSRREIREEARESYIKARYFWNKRTPDDIRRSIDYFRRAIEKDPEYPLAWTGLADTYIMLGIFGLEPPNEVLIPAKEAAERALSLDESLSEAHTVLAEVQKLFEWNWAAAEPSYLRAIELDQNYAVAHHWYAQLLSILGRHDEAQKQIEMARRCDPVSATIAAFFSYVALEARRVEAAIAAGREALELDANAPITHYLLGRAYAIAGDMPQAIATLQTALRLAGGLPFIEACLGYAYARTGDQRRAEQILAGLRTRALTSYVSQIDLALVYLGLHDRDAAVELLEEGYRTRAVRTVIIGDPFFSELLSETRYRELLTSLRLPLPS